MSNLVFNYKDQNPVHFEEQNNDILVNATEMAKVFGKKTELFLKSENTKAFIGVLIRQPNGGRIKNLERKDIIQNRGRNGVYFHRLLAIKFAAWLSPEFEVWVFSTIESVLFGELGRFNTSLKESAQRKLKMDALTEKLNTVPEYLELQQLKQDEKAAKWNRKLLLEKQLEKFTDQLSLSFD